MQKVIENLAQKTAQISYKEVKIGKTLYRVTSVFEGRIDLAKTLENLTVKRALQALSDVKTECENF